MDDFIIDDSFFQADPPPPVRLHNEPPPWKIMIVDDEQEVHSVTRMVFEDFQFEERKLQFLHAYSGEEAIRILLKESDIALILLDVVMETDHAGLDVAQMIRNQLGNRFTRIILRTGQPGQAPERDIILNYDINDYKEKSELTAQKLFTTVLSALRSYRDLKTIDISKQGLHHIIDASASLFEPKSLERFSKGIFLQLYSLLNIQEGGFFQKSITLTARYEADQFQVIASSEQFDDEIPEGIFEALREARENKKSYFDGNLFVGYYPTKLNVENFLYLKAGHILTELEQELILTFSANIGIAFDNIYLNREVIESQRELLYLLGEAVEAHSHETGQHVLRVSLYAALLGKGYGLGEDDLELLQDAAPLHDIGKLAIPHEILNKPGRLNREEYEVMKKHALKGYELLGKSNRKVIKTAAMIAREHHEHWDGNGYPAGLKGEEIHIFSRLTAIADVFDALSHKRIYKDAWPLDKIKALFTEERGKQFDPDIVDLFLENWDEILEIYHRYPDQ